MKMFFSLTVVAFCMLQTGAQTVGIGTPNPTRAKLEVHGAVDYTAAIFGGDGTGISLQRNNPGIGFNTYYNNGHSYLAGGYGANQFLDAATGNMAINMFGYGNPGSLVSVSRRALLLTKEGKVVFGTTPGQGATLNVGRGIGTESTAYFSGTTHHSVFHFGAAEHTYIRAGKDEGTVFINDIPGGKTALSGPVGIGTATPAYPLEIRMDAAQRGLLLSEPFNGYSWSLSVRTDDPDLFLSPGGAYRGYFDHTDASYHNISDRRLKKAIHPLNYILPKIMKMDVVTYEMKDHNPNHKKSIGVIAQNVATLFPQIVSVQKGTVKGHTGVENLHMVSYRSFGVLAIQAIKEQEAILKAQANTLKNIEAELEALEKLFNSASIK